MQIKVMILKPGQPTITDTTPETLNNVYGANRIEFAVDGVDYMALCRKFPRTGDLPAFKEHSAYFLPALICRHDMGECEGLTSEDIERLTSHLAMKWDSSGRIVLQITGAEVPEYQPFI